MRRNHSKTTQMPRACDPFNSGRFQRGRSVLGACGLPPRARSFFIKINFCFIFAGSVSMVRKPEKERNDSNLDVWTIALLLVMALIGLMFETVIEGVW